MKVLVLGRSVEPGRAHHVDVAGARDDQLAWPTAGFELEEYHVGDRGREVWKSGFDDGTGYALNRRGFLGQASPLFQAAHRGELLEHGLRDELLLGCPFDHALDLADSGVDIPTGQSIVDHPLADRFQAALIQAGGGHETVQRFERSQGVFVVLQLPAGIAVWVTIVRLRVRPELKEHFVHGEIVGERNVMDFALTAAVGVPLGKDALVRRTALPRIVFAEQDIVPVACQRISQGDDRLP
jgi:hypothetical protein